jgi:hypothetical protein
VSLPLGYVVVPSFRWSSAPELLDAHSRRIAADHVSQALAVVGTARLVVSLPLQGKSHPPGQKARQL